MTCTEAYKEHIEYTFNMFYQPHTGTLREARGTGSGKGDN